VVATAGLVGVGAFAGASVATADTNDQTEALGRFLGGGGGDIDLDDIVALAGAHAAYPSGPELETAVIDATVLDAINAELEFDLFGDNGVIALGAVNQYAAADAEGAQAASGAVNDQGAIEIGGSEEFPGNASIDLTGAFADTLVDQIVSDLYLELGALSATAEWPVGGEPTGDYQIAAASLELASPAVEDITALVNDDVVPTINTAVNSLTGSEGALAGVLDDLDVLDALLAALGSQVNPTVALDVDLAGALAPVLADSFGNEGVVINLADGTVTVDLETILGEGSLNDLPPNTELLTDEAVAAITAGLTAALDDLTAELVDAVNTALRSAELTFTVDASVLGGATTLDISVVGTLAEVLDGTADASVTAALAGIPVVLPVDALLDALAGPLNAVLFGEAGLVGSLAGTVNAEVVAPTLTALSPVFDVLNDIVSIVVNVQEQPGDLPNHVSGTESFTQRALSLAVLPEEGALVELDFASATVRASDEDGTEVDGVEVDGVEVDGVEVDGVEVDGVEVDGVEVDGVEVDGTEVDGTEVDGTEVDGDDNGTEVDGSDDNGTAGGGGMLPRTGAEVMAWIAIALLLIGAGTAAVMIAKRRAASLS
jgi:hypothetical protein